MATPVTTLPETLTLGAVGMLIFGIVVLYIFGLGWGILRAWKKSREQQRTAS